MLVQRIDGGASLLYGVPVEGPAFTQVHPAFDASLAEAFHATDRPFLEDRPFFHLDHQNQEAVLIPLFDQDIVELTGPEERGDGPLDIAVIDRLMNNDAGAPDDLGCAQAVVTGNCDAIDGGWAGVLGREFGSRPENDTTCSKQKRTAHRQTSLVGRRASDGARRT